MKKCEKCGATFGDELNFCTHCGGALVIPRDVEIKSFVKKYLIYLLVGVLIIGGVVTYLVIENKKVADAQKAIQDYQLQKYIDEQKSKANTWDLQIERGWTWEKDGNYTYIRGSVKNVGSKTINYYKLSAEFLDSKGNVVDTDWTNSGNDLKPDSSRKFEIMHKYDSAFKDATLEVSEVR